jgi:hypothetical protein
LHRERRAFLVACYSLRKDHNLIIRRVMTYLRFSLFRASMLLVFLGGLLTVAKEVVGQIQKEPPPCTDLRFKSQAVVRGLVFKAYVPDNPDNGACVRVYRNGKLVHQFADDAEEYFLGQPGDSQLKIPFVPDGTDVTGRGHPDMIVSSWSGGAHCCFKHYVFELEPKLRLLATIDEGDANGHFEYLERDHRYYYVTEDIWSYWPASFASSTHHKVLLHFVDDEHGGAFHLDLEKMRYPAPSPERWKAALKDVDDEVRDDPDHSRANLGSTLWDTVLDLIYTGHSDLAWKFVAEVDPKALEGNYPDLTEFCQLLQSDPFWPEIKPTLKATPPECANAKPGRKD